jgi:DNA-binding SARP family transcriptional activator
MHIVRRGLIEWLGGATIVLVRGPAGSGKSVFARQLAESWERPVTVLRGRSIRADAVSAAIGEGAAVVLDDAHLCDDAEAVTDAIERAWGAARPAAVVVCARRATPFETLIERPDARSIPAPMLHLSADEIGQLLDVNGIVAASALRDDLHAATHGWPMLVHRSVERLAVDPSWSPSGPNGASALTRDVLDALGATTPAVHLLARVPLIDDVVIEAAGAAPADVFDVVPMVRHGRWSVMPAAIATPLHSTSALDGAFVATAGRRYIEFGEIEPALNLLLQHSTPSAAAEILASVHWSALGALDVWQLRELTRAMSDVGSPAAGAVLLAAARAAEYVDRDLWNDGLTAAADVGADDTPLRRAVLAERARYVLRGGDVEAGPALAAQILDAVTAAEPVTRARALAVLAMADAFECTAESCARAAKRYREAAALYRHAQEWTWRADALARLGYTALYMAGYPAEGREAMEQALALLPIGDRTRAFWLTNYCDVLDYLGRAVEADAVVGEALEIGSRLRDDNVMGMAWWSRSWLAAHRNDPAGFRRAVGEVERHRGEWMQGGTEVEYLASTAEHHLLVGDVDGYTAYIDAARTVGERIGFTEPVELAAMWFHATVGDAARARDELARLEGTPAVVAVNRPRRLLLRAVAHLRLGETDLARARLADAMQTAAEMGAADLHIRQHARLLDQLAPIVAAEPTASPGLHVRMLGQFSVVSADGSMRTPQPGHPATLVKLVALNGPTTADTVIDWLWPDADAATGRARLRNVLNRLKDRSGPILVREGETLRLANDVVVDFVEFERAAAESLSVGPEERIGRARQAVALYAGDLLPGDLYEDWASGHRERLRRRFVALADAVAADAEARGDSEEAARLLDLAVEIEPLDEVRTLRLCTMMQADGRTLGAAAVAKRCIDLLSELGLDPGRDLARIAALTG